MTRGVANALNPRNLGHVFEQHREIGDATTYPIKFRDDQTIGFIVLPILLAVTIWVPSGLKLALHT